jgi:hypothetical protein
MNCAVSGAGIDVIASERLGREPITAPARGLPSRADVILDGEAATGLLRNGDIRKRFNDNVLFVAWVSPNLGRSI